MPHNPQDPHANEALTFAGTSLADARVAMVMVHGRGASAQSILTLAPALEMTGLAFVAPQAAGGTWYPLGFMAPIDQNEPGISSGMRAIDRALSVVEAAGIPRSRTIMLGFSQGACLASEYVARHATRYGGLAVLSGGLIGPDGTPRDYAGSLDDTPIFLGCSDIDGHIPATRVQHTSDVLKKLGGDVTMRLYPGMGHLVNEDEIGMIREMVSNTLGA